MKYQFQFDGTMGDGTSWFTNGTVSAPSWGAAIDEAHKASFHQLVEKTATCNGPYTVTGMMLARVKT
jgi:hypothetical protein